jgi:hypothetical protein
VKCCRCGEAVDAPSGWCSGCLTWPPNVAPIRFDNHNHRLDADGFCWTCKDYQAAGLEWTPRGWIDTHKVGVSLPSEENKRRMVLLQQQLATMGQRPERDVEAEKAALEEWERARTAEAEVEMVPF